MDVEAIEIDFLPVGTGQTSGDAIALRYVQGGNFYIHVVDGGNLEESGPQLVQHISQYYRNPRQIENVVCTHPDNDHSSGLRAIFDAFNVKNLWMLRPWLYARQLTQSFKGGWTADRLRARLRNVFPILVELEDKALQQGTNIFEPLMGASIGPFAVLSPTLQSYLELLPHFDKADMPTPATPIPAGISSPGAKAMQIHAATGHISENWSTDNLRENVVTSASNETSVVQYVRVNEYNLLLTADAGKRSLALASGILNHYQLLPITFSQIPHHGSRNNVTPTILNALLGPVVPAGSVATKTAAVSAAKDDPDHPRRSVVNGYIRRGCSVISTEGVSYRYYINLSSRPLWGSVVPIEFSPRSEAW